MILYFGDAPQQRFVTVPDFTGMTRQQAADKAGSLGLYILVKGNEALSPEVKVISQSAPQGSQLEMGMTVELIFADTKAAD